MVAALVVLALLELELALALAQAEVEEEEEQVIDGSVDKDPMVVRVERQPDIGVGNTLAPADKASSAGHRMVAALQREESRHGSRNGGSSRKAALVVDILRVEVHPFADIADHMAPGQVFHNAPSDSMAVQVRAGIHRKHPMSCWARMEELCEVHAHRHSRLALGGD